jgi:branched-chain amino acid aminotransferase
MLIINGQSYEAGAPETTLLNRSFKYGDGLFETIRIFRGKPLFLPQHMARLFRGMTYLRLDFVENFFREELEEGIHKCLEVNQIHEHGRVRLHVFRKGEGAYSPNSNQSAYVIEGYSLKGDYFAQSNPLSICSFSELGLSHTPLSGFKTANSLPYILGSIYAKEQGFDEALLFCDGWVSEASSANVFLIRQRKLLTPPLSSGCLPGIMRSEVLRLANSLQIPVQEKRLKIKDLTQGDEVFLTNSIRGILPVIQVDQQSFLLRKNSLTAFLQSCLLQYIEEIHG